MTSATSVLYPEAACRHADVFAATPPTSVARARSYGAAMDAKGAQLSERPPVFEIARRDLAGAPGVRVRGEVDVASIPRMTEALDDAIRESEGAFVIDLCDVDFLDSSGLSALMRARALLGRDDRALAVICPPGPVRRLFEVAGVTDLLFIYESREAAAAALVPPN
jgi:anti-sigma B factor antagonist